jgi:hypothetical protein
MTAEAARVIGLSQRKMEFNADNGIVGVGLGEPVMTTRSASRPRHSVEPFNFSAPARIIYRAMRSLRVTLS